MVGKGRTDCSGHSGILRKEKHPGGCRIQAVEKVDLAVADEENLPLRIVRRVKHSLFAGLWSVRVGQDTLALVHGHQAAGIPPDETAG